MLDHTLDGVPVSQVATVHLRECLRDGVYIDDTDPVGTTVEDVLKRIEIELLARDLGLRAEGL